ncbi:hypothetical protein OG279_00440 [Streptomyces sp. NBC_01201]|uniref:GNAT family N-acetyltransferase n=1 Tax=Streptomyces glycanivorans TaxID=3033808 RepID=A0ABY9JRF3_9ACTN|nr:MULTISPECIES: hypothetical protein [unclassified Streptomyces]TXS15140.1 hypothetical protein EAO68_18585 [Streptomyces sp. wa22]WLQ69164.1 hypothetical protein P8A20_36775 [Streptomyces sp. Alt3]WSQ89868.1 hypothetical protein OG722_36180 [Streptomyces sp. NBC_01212]WSR11525.1 hypothetical protein OG265_35960 [Streptomyces sp. NBC_01208]WSR53210.1 hypothetical protein OG279_00440 [Streptomyces sp. NBC_01201]
MPHTLRAIDGEDETLAALEMIVGFDDDLPGEVTRAANRRVGWDPVRGLGLLRFRWGRWRV